MYTAATFFPYALLLLTAGIACGFVNTLASSGSAISLPILLTLGLPALAANATNRLPVLFGSLMALRTFHTEGKLDWVAAAKIVVPATLGSAVGVWAAETIRNRQMGLVLTAAMLMALLLLFTKLKAALARDHHQTPHITSLGLFVLFFVGVWLGFIVLDGATYLLLVLILLFGMICHTQMLSRCSFSLPPRWCRSRCLHDPATFGGPRVSFFRWAASSAATSAPNSRATRKLVFGVTVIVLELIHLGIHYFGLPTM
jgi:Sulfite exporter TauE/SafE